MLPVDYPIVVLESIAETYIVKVPEREGSFTLETYNKVKTSVCLKILDTLMVVELYIIQLPVDCRP